MSVLRCFTHDLIYLFRYETFALLFWRSHGPLLLPGLYPSFVYIISSFVLIERSHPIHELRQ
ncbi:MAG: hypothetical protein RL610_1329 [Pseudomonadota bacterium]|jgi:hypothetical protein